MSLIRLSLALAAGASLAGCAYAPPQFNVASGKGSLQLRTQLVHGGYRAQADGILPYAQGDVAHMVLKLYKVANGVESTVVDATNAQLTKDIAKADLGQPIGFGNLHPMTTYRIKAFAYKATGELPADLISVAASSSLDVRVETDERPTVTTLVVQLADRPFRAEGTSSIVVTPGDYDTDFEGIR
ncbi:hypothetical protein D3C86_1064650 [compost metagenome]